ncbi:retrovirus-related pol polyprotein from transposon TNT 1-94 [Tanacetum coccineum]
MVSLEIRLVKNLRMQRSFKMIVMLKLQNIILLGLPTEVYSLVNHHQVAKDNWDRVKLLMQGTELSQQERECKLYDDFDRFTLHVQVNTKFLNTLPPEWSKFVTDVKLARNMHTTNYDQLYAYLSQHEAHAIKVRLLRESNATSSVINRNRGNNAAVQARIFRCYNCQGEGHMARQCTQPKRPRNSTLSGEQTFWLPISNPISEQLVVPSIPVKIEVVKERTTPSAIIKDIWGFEHTKEVFITQVILFLNSLRESFKDFDNGLHDELNEVKTVFNQMEAAVGQCFVYNKCFDIQKKELLLENDRLLELIIS